MVFKTDDELKISMSYDADAVDKLVSDEDD